jgi:hypothetical protein
MSKFRRGQAKMVAALVAAAGILYAIRWWFFPSDALRNEMWRFLIGDVGFLFLQVLLVTLFIDRQMEAREREAMLQKLNMVIGAFYSEIGTRLMGEIARADSGFDAVREQVLIRPTWNESDYARAKQAIRSYEFRVETKACDLESLRTTLLAEKPFLLGLLSNQNLLEHETFTELLWAVTHLAEELEARPDLQHLPEPDAHHVAGDINRAYVLIVSEWLDYMRHLQHQYPFLFSLAVRTNPLDPAASATVTQ